MRKTMLALGLGLFLTGASGVQAAEYQRDEIITWATPVPSGLDPHTFRSVGEYSASLNIYDRLYRYQGNPPELVPSLATSHTVTADGKKWTFKLRSDVKFHDGKVMSASDVVYSFRRMFALGRGPSALFSQVMKPENIVAPDATTVEMTLDKPYAPFLSAIPLVSIINEAQTKANEQNGDSGTAWLASNDAGSGPYKVVPGSFVAQTRAVLEWHPDYFMGWNPKPIKQVNLQYVKEVSTKVLALMKGELDGTDSRLQPDQIDQLSKEKGIVVHKEETMRIYVIFMNNQRAPLDNVHVRRAISYAFNYKGFISGLLKDLHQRDPVPMPRNLWAFPKDIKGYEYNLAKAREELELAKKQGVDLSRPLKISVLIDSSDSVQSAEVLQSDLRKIGITLEIEKTLFQNVSARTNKPETTPDMWTTWVSSFYIDPENWIGEMYDSKLHGRWKGSSWYKNAKVDELLDKAREVNDQGQRKQLYGEAARIIVEDAPTLWIYNSVDVRGMRDRVKNFSVTPGGGENFHAMSLAPDK